MRIDSTLNVICVAYRKTPELRMLINCFFVQSDPRWNLFIIHDGPPPADLVKMIEFYRDPRIKFEFTEKVNGSWGHPNRRMMLRKMPHSRKDFILITNDDNYYVPLFVEMMMTQARKEANNTGIVYCNTVHNYTKYDVLETRLKRGSVDMGSFIVRSDVARKVGFNSDEFDADGIYAEECAQYCSKMKLKLVHIRKALFVHN